MEQKLIGRGGPGRGQGRKPKATSNAMRSISIKVTEPQREKLVRLGGGKWVRARIDEATVEGETPSPSAN